jgi:hypothetical protein
MRLNPLEEQTDTSTCERKGFREDSIAGISSASSSRASWWQLQARVAARGASPLKSPIPLHLRLACHCLPIRLPSRLERSNPEPWFSRFWREAIKPREACSRQLGGSLGRWLNRANSRNGAKQVRLEAISFVKSTRMGRGF